VPYRPFHRLVASTITAGLVFSSVAAASETGLPAPIPFTLGALVEVEAFRTNHDGFGGDAASDLTLATLALSLDAPLGDWAALHLSSLYGQRDTPLEIDEATLTLGNPAHSPFSLTLGQIYLPFGRFDTHLVSDPFTLELGGGRETAALLAWERDGLQAAVWLFNGDLDEAGGNSFDNGGARLGYAQGDEAQGGFLGAGYTNDLADSDGIGGALEEAGIGRVGDAVAGPGLDVAFHAAGFHWIGEYLTALDGFQPEELAHRNRGAKPAAWNLEAGYAFDLAGYAATAAIGHQQTRQALALGLPASRWALGLSLALTGQIGLGWARDSDYGRADGGSGGHSHSLTAQLAVEL